jgi:N-hydroxyarylamine O-acetyltransferase
MLSIPFENLDIHLGRQLSLDYASLFDKIVVRRRGGFCYELNGLFALLIAELGFEVSMLSAGVAREGGGFGPEFDHMTLLVRLEEPWLADVGFGDSFLEPLKLEPEIPATDQTGTYRIAREGRRYLLLKHDQQGNAVPQYRFTLDPHDIADYSEMCFYHQTSPLSTFTRRRVCTRATADGRITLSDMRLIVTSRGERTERALANDGEYKAALADSFGVGL